MCNTESEIKNKIRIVPWMLNSYVVNMNTLPSSLPLLFYSLYNNYKILSKRISFEQIATSKIIAVFNHGTPRGSQHTQNVWGLFYLSTKKKVGVGGLCCFKNMHVSQSRAPFCRTIDNKYDLNMLVFHDVNKSRKVSNFAFLLHTEISPEIVAQNMTKTKETRMLLHSLKKVFFLVPTTDL